MARRVDGGRPAGRGRLRAARARSGVGRGPGSRVRRPRCGIGRLEPRSRCHDDVTDSSRRCPHRLARSPRQASTRHRRRRMEAARRRGLRRRVDQLVARSRSRDRRSSRAARRFDRRRRDRRGGVPSSAAGDPPRPRRQRARTGPRQAATPDSRVGIGHAASRRVRRMAGRSSGRVGWRGGRMGAVPVRSNNAGDPRWRWIAARRRTARQPTLVLGRRRRDRCRQHRAATSRR